MIKIQFQIQIHISDDDYDDYKSNFPKRKKIKSTYNEDFNDFDNYNTYNK